jgi:site-specific DNA-cytosine methylase
MYSALISAEADLHARKRKRSAEDDPEVASEPIRSFDNALWLKTVRPPHRTPSSSLPATIQQDFFPEIVAMTLKRFKDDVCDAEEYESRAHLIDESGIIKRWRAMVDRAKMKDEKLARHHKKKRKSQYKLYTGKTGPKRAKYKKNAQYGVLGGTRNKKTMHIQNTPVDRSIVAFAGFGFVALAGDSVGVPPIFLAENDAGCLKVLRSNFDEKTCAIEDVDLLPGLDFEKGYTDAELAAHAAPLADHVARLIKQAALRDGIVPSEDAFRRVDKVVSEGSDENDEHPLLDTVNFFYQSSIECNDVSLVQNEATRDEAKTMLSTRFTFEFERLLRQRIPITASFYEQVNATVKFNTFLSEEMTKRGPGYAHVQLRCGETGTPQHRLRQFLVSGNRRKRARAENVLEALRQNHLPFTRVSDAASVCNVDGSQFHLERGDNQRASISDAGGWACTTNVPYLVSSTMAQDGKPARLKLPTAHRLALQGVDPHFFFIPVEVNESAARKGIANGVPVPTGEVFWSAIRDAGVGNNPSPGHVHRKFRRLPSAALRSSDDVDDFFRAAADKKKHAWRYRVGDAVELDGDTGGVPKISSYAVRVREAVASNAGGNSHHGLCGCLCSRRAMRTKTLGAFTMDRCQSHLVASRGLGDRRGVGKKEDRWCFSCGNDDPFTDPSYRMSTVINGLRNDKVTHPRVLSCVDPECRRVFCERCLVSMLGNAFDVMTEKNDFLCFVCDAKDEPSPELPDRSL